LRDEAGRRIGLISVKGKTCGHRRLPWVMISYGDKGVDRYGDERVDRKVNKKDHTGTLGARRHVELKL
jgi:hypothetical protein